MSRVLIEIEVPKWHEGQSRIMENSKRFNVIACGRRFGKTEMAKRLLLYTNDNGKLNGALNGYPVAYFAPTYKMLMEVWRGVNISYYKLIEKVSESEKRVELVGGGSIEFWSFDSYESVRGRKYKRVVCDESAILKSDKLKNAWEQAIRALLTDYKGDAWFLSTPKGKKHYFHELAQNHKKDPKNWAFFQMPTSVNPYIDKDEIEDARLMLPPVVFAQEYEALFTDMVSDNLFIQTFNLDRHVAKAPIEFNPALQTFVSIDFNVSPLCCIVAQMDMYFNQINIIDEYRQMDSDIYELTTWLKSKYDTRRIFVTGDSAGFNRSVYSRGHQSAWDIVKMELNLNWSQVKTAKGKPSGYVNNKRLLGNALFAKHPNLHIGNCPWLIEDLTNVECDSTGQMNKTRNSTESHLLDALLDFFYSCCSDAVKMPSMRG